MFNQNDTDKDTPDVDTIEETNWESANALVDKLIGVGQKWPTLFFDFIISITISNYYHISVPALFLFLSSDKISV